MNLKKRELLRLWAEALHRFGASSNEAEDISAIIDYWNSKGWPDTTQTDHDIQVEITGYRNECIRHQGMQPWDYEKFKDRGNYRTWWHVQTQGGAP